MSHSRLIGPLSLSRTAIIESRIFRTPCRHCLSVVIIEPQLRLLRMIQSWTCHIPRLLSHNCACCAYYEGLAAHALTPNTLDLVLAWIVVSCSRSWSHIMHNLPKIFLFGSIFYLIVLCGIIYLYTSPSGHNSCIKLYSAWKCGKLNWNIIKHR
jgi:hypothetical protein